MFFLLGLLASKPFKDKRAVLVKRIKRSQLINPTETLQEQTKWLPKLFPILGLSLLATSILTLLQSALPLDLVQGGISRPAISEAWCGAILALQLILLVLFQWPIGHWLSTNRRSFGLAISITNFCIGANET